MPVSTTHSAVGGMIGMTMVIGGVDCVNWYEPSDNFPFIGVFQVVYFLGSSLLYSLLYSQWHFLQSELLCCVIQIVLLEVVLSNFRRYYNYFECIFDYIQGSKGIGLHKTELWVALVSAFGGGLVVGLIMMLFFHLLKEVLKRIEKRS